MFNNYISLILIFGNTIQFVNGSFQQFLIHLSKDPHFSMNAVKSIIFLSEDEEYDHIWRLHDLFFANIPSNIVSESRFQGKEVGFCLEGTLIVTVKMEANFISGRTVNKVVRKMPPAVYTTSCLWLFKNGTQLDASKLTLNSQVYTYHMIQNETSIFVEEIYSIKSAVTVRNVILDWPKHDGTVHFWERRSDFKGISLKHAVLEWKGYLDKVTNGEEMWAGSLKDVVNYLKRKMNFKVIYYEPADCQWGLLMKNGSWTGLVKDVLDHKADFTTGLTVTKERLLYIDYTFEIYPDHQTIMMLHPNKAVVNWTAYINIFTVNAWKGFFGVFIVIIVGYLVVNNMPPWEALALNALLILQRGFDIKSCSLSIKILYFNSCLFGFIFFAYYSAVLTSLMTAAAPEPLIRSFKDINDKNMDVFVLQGTSSEAYLSNSEPESDMYKAYQRLQESNNYVHSTEGEREMIRAGNLVFGSASAKKGLEDEMMALDLEESKITSVAFTLPKNSEFQGIFNYHILKLHETGIYGQMHFRHFFNRKPKMKKQQNSQEAVGLGYPNLLFPFMILGCGILCSLAICAPSEHILGRNMKKY